MTLRTRQREQGRSHIKGDQIITGDQTVQGDQAVTGTLAVTGATTLTGALALTGALTINDGLYTAKVKKIAITTVPTGAAQDTGFDLPTRGIVLDVFVRVTTAEATGATKTLDVGLLAGESGGDADGFLDGVSVASTGVVRGNFVATTGSNNTYLGAASTHTIGVLLTRLLIAGEDTAAGGDGVGVLGSHILNGTARSVVYTAGSNDWEEFTGEIWIVYLDFTE